MLHPHTAWAASGTGELPARARLLNPFQSVGARGGWVKHAANLIPPTHLSPGIERSELSGGDSGAHWRLKKRGRFARLLPVMSSQRKIFPTPEAIAGWRNSLPANAESVAVVTGSFDIFQPGNLLAIRTAARQAAHVCVIVDAQARPASRDWFWHPAAIRMEFVAGLRGVDAVSMAPANQWRQTLQPLVPYTLVDCASQPADPLRQEARALAHTTLDVPVVPGCFSADIAARLLQKATPIPVPEEVCEPWPTPVQLEELTRRQAGQRLVTVNGCFDILHLGHLRLLAQARQLGHELIVLVNDDASLRAYKGQQRPIFPIHFRLSALQALQAVSLAYPFAGDNPLSLLAQIRPDIHVKGGSYEAERIRQEKDLVSSWGGRLECMPLLPGFSTTDLLKRALA